MPRLTHPTYCAQHKFLSRVWVENRGSWSHLFPGEQWGSARLLRPDASVLRRGVAGDRQKITALHPSLPQRAGRALKKRELAYAAEIALTRERAAHPAPVEPVKKKRQSKDQVIRVTSLVHPEPDIQKLVKALIALAKEQEAAKRKKNTHTDDAADHETAA